MPEPIPDQPLPRAARAVLTIKRAITTFRHSPWPRGIAFLLACVAGWMIARYMHQSIRGVQLGPDASLGRLDEALQHILNVGSAMFR